MEFVAGKTLEEMISTAGPLSLKLSLEIIAQVTSALAAAHQAGLVHRDIKPANLIVAFDGKNRPVVKVIDFGLVKPRRFPTMPQSLTPAPFWELHNMQVRNSSLRGR